MRRAAALLVALALLLSACGGSSDGSLTAMKLDPPFTVSPIALTDTAGQPYSLTASTKDPLTLVFFGYTHCPDVCGAVMASLASAMTRLSSADRARVQVVFVTTDPSRDTGPVLKQYLSHFDPAFVGLTGDLPTIEKVAFPFGIGISKGQKLPSGGYDVTHGSTITGIVRDDKAPYYWHEDTSSAQFASDIHTLLNKS